MTILAAFSDGGCIGRNPSPLGGTYAWCHVGANDLHVAEGSGILRPADVQGLVVTNNQAEFYALLCALEGLPDGWAGAVCSDSAVTIGRFFNGWAMQGIPDAWTGRAELAVRRLARVALFLEGVMLDVPKAVAFARERGRLVPLLLDGHPTRAQLRAGIGKRGGPVSIHNVWCDLECRRAGRTHA